MDRPAPSTRSGATPHGDWSYVAREPPVALRPYVRGFMGYREGSRVVVRRHELPSGTAPLIIGVDAGIDVHPPGHDERRPVRLTSFVAGLHESSALTVHRGAWIGLQVDLTPFGARRLIGMPMHELLNRDISLRDALGPAGDRLEESVNDARDWPARIALVEDFLIRRLGERPPPRVEVLRAWSALDASDGRLPISVLMRETGWSARYLSVRFRDEVGVPPKLFAQLVRFRRAVELIDAGDPVDLAWVAAAAGFADQSHLSREVRRFSGLSPTGLRAQRVAEGSVAIAARPEVTFVHDRAASPL